jgi:hypothetical protein
VREGRVKGRGGDETRGATKTKTTNEGEDGKSRRERRNDEDVIRAMIVIRVRNRQIRRRSVDGGEGRRRSVASGVEAVVEVEVGISTATIPSVAMSDGEPRRREHISCVSFVSASRALSL